MTRYQDEADSCLTEQDSCSIRAEQVKGQAQGDSLERGCGLVLSALPPPETHVIKAWSTGWHYRKVEKSEMGPVDGSFDGLQQVPGR